MATEPSSQIVIQARFEELRDLAQWVERLAAEFSLSSAVTHRIDLCLSELVTNVISYGYPDAGAGTVRIRFWRHADRIVIRIDDDGIPFDPTSYEAPGLPTSLAEAPDGGRGIRLARNFSDELHHVAAAAGNQLTLVFRCAGTGTPLSTPAGTQPP